MSNLTTGVISGCEVTLDGGSGLRLHVAPGAISDNGRTVFVTGGYLQLSAADPDLSRIDSVYVSLVDGSLILAEGTPQEFNWSSVPATGAAHLADTETAAGAITASIFDRRNLITAPAGRVFFADYISLDTNYDTDGTGMGLGGRTVYLGAQTDPDENGIWFSAPTSGVPWTYGVAQPDHIGDVLRAGTGPYSSVYPSVWIRTDDGLAATGMVDIFATLRAAQISTTGTDSFPSIDYPTVEGALDVLWAGGNSVTLSTAADWNNDLPGTLSEALDRIAAAIGPVT